ncbi:MAG: Rrf2 family transcriptional regulator [Candidatus Omnitrophica bacterium]|nr:Rrf2 family transcriptional regulator [Candidatus Omnitrophota bacterium]
MKLLTKNTDYAIRALIELTVHKEEYLSARSIANKQKMPFQFLRSIMQELIKYKIVSSKEGVKGGLKLIADPAKIKIVDIIRIFQGEIELSDCMFQQKICENRKTCVLRKEIKRIEKLVENEFGKLTVKGLVKKISKQEKGGK